MKLIKVLTKNDLGQTGSHQAGFHVPKSLIGYLPALDEATLNPDCWLVVTCENAGNASWRYVHYNNKIVSGGTRDEYRVTHTTSALRLMRAEPGDELILEFAANGDAVWSAWVVRLRSKEQDGTRSSVLRLDRSGW